MERTPLLLLGDSPRMPSGLGRLARDVGALLASEQEALGIDLLQVGWEDLDAASYGYLPSYAFTPVFDLGHDWGKTRVQQITVEYFGPDAQPILFGLWDPSRLIPYVCGRDSWPGPVWAYPALDGTNVHGSLGGQLPAFVALVDSLLAYGRWAAGVYRPLRQAPVSYLPHGLQTVVPALAPPWGDRWSPAAHVLGVVATNQPRKDWHSAVRLLHDLHDVDAAWRGWFHVDQLVTPAWSLPELIALYQLQDAVVVTTSLDDGALAAAYAACTITYAPGRGEGFGYPVVESLQQGTPAVIIDYAGAAELVPMAAWRAQATASQIEGAYAIRRPIADRADLLRAAEAAATAAQDPSTAAYCRGAVAHLAWDALWPRWRSWIRRELQVARTQGARRRREAREAGVRVGLR